MLLDKVYVLSKLDWMRENRIWPSGRTIILLVSLHAESSRDAYLSDAEWVVVPVGNSRRI